MTSRRSSGSSSAESLVEPARSQKATVNGLRSAPVGADLVGTDSYSSLPSASCRAPVKLRAAPQSPQNALPCGLAAPHWMHFIVRSGVTAWLVYHHSSKTVIPQSDSGACPRWANSTDLVVLGIRHELWAKVGDGMKG